MTVTIELTPEEEARVAVAARIQGIAVDECVRRLVAEHLPDARDAKVARVRAFLAGRASGIPSQRRISPAVARKADEAWRIMDAAVGPVLRAPRASTGPDGEVLFTWDEEEHHLELEIFEADAAVFFYRNRRTEETWDTDYVVGEAIPSEALDRLRLFTDHEHE